MGTSTRRPSKEEEMNMHGPYGIAYYRRNTTNMPDEEIEQAVRTQLHPLIKSLPGFRSVMYYNIDELEYYFVISFVDEASTDSALQQLQALAESTGAKVSKAEVVTGELVDQMIAGENAAR